MSSLTNTASKLSPSESLMESCQSRPSLVTCVSSCSPVQLESTGDLRTWLQAAFPVNHSALQESGPAQTTQEICGPPPSPPYARLDHDTASLRTFQASWLADTLSESYATLPKAGIACDGVVYQQPKWARRISVIGYGLLPTPNTMDSLPPKSPEALHREATVTRPGRRQPSNLRDAVSNMQRWPTPRQFMHKDSTTDRGKGNLGEVVGGKLNPTWVEWLMGWPLGWTDLRPLAMDKFRLWQQQHGIY